MVVNIVVKDVVLSREMSLVYTDQDNTGVKVSVHDLRNKCGIFWGCNLGTNALFIHDHRFFRSGEETIAVTKSSTTVIYLLCTSPTLAQDSKVNISLDEVSMNAALDWLSNSAGEGINPVTSQLVLALHDPASNLTTEGNQGQQEAQAVPAPLPPAAPVNWIELLQLRKLVQLIFFYFVFTYNRPYSDQKKAFIALTMFFVYLLQVGLFSWLLGKLLAQFKRDDVNNERINANGQNGVPPVNGAVVPPEHNRAPAARNVGFMQAIINALHSLSRHGVRIPRTQGIVYDIYSFFVAMVGSVVPGWQPLVAVEPLQ